MNDISNDCVGSMRNASDLGELVRERMDYAGWNVAETTARRERGTAKRGVGTLYGRALLVAALPDGLLPRLP